MSPQTTPNGFSLDPSGRRVVIDPVTRIEGHLRLELNIDERNVVRNAVCSGTMWRGLELILKDRDPRDAWAFAERICGVCTGPHALASVRAVEQALGIEIPQNANLIRNAMHLVIHIHDHLVHFYHLHALDWVDVVSALLADPKATSALAQSLSPWPKASVGYYRDVLDRLKKFVGSGQLGPFRNGYWGHSAYTLPPEANLMAMAHYIEALDFQREIVKIHAVLGGKSPHPHWLVGGVPTAINVHATGAVGALHMERLNILVDVGKRDREFVAQVYVPDVLALFSYYKEWATIGGGLSSRSLLSYGEFPTRANTDSNEFLALPRGAILNGDLSRLHPVDLQDPREIQEFVTHSWYRYPDDTQGLHPWEGVTQSDFRIGPKGRLEDEVLHRLDEEAKYSFIKAPRYKGHAMEVGPLARLVIASLSGRVEIRSLLDDALGRLSLPFSALFSTLGRTLARALETQWAAEKLVATVDDLIANLRNGNLDTCTTDKWSPSTWPKTCKGVGFVEAPRGSLGHWVVIENQRIANYQCVVPTTWNGSPRDPKGEIGAFEASLMDVRLADPSQPVEALRVIHSFDPCLACSTHVIGPQGEALASVQVT